MRTRTTAERNLLKSNHFNIHLKVEVTDADGVWKDLTALGGSDWVVSARWGSDIDTPVSGGSITIAREHGFNSLSPMIEASLLNRKADNTYGPLLNVSRLIRWFSAVTLPNVAPGPSDWKEVFTGKIDDVSWPGVNSYIELTVRDLGAFLIDANIETAREYGSEAGVPVQTVMQQILDDNGIAVTLYTPVSPGWNIRPYEQAKDVSVMEALLLLAQQIGYDVRYKYDASDVARLTFYQPDRGKTVEDDTFDHDEYIDITTLNVSDADIRNVLELEYFNSATQLPDKVVRVHAASILQHRRRYMRLQESGSSNIDTTTEAVAMADAVLADISTVYASHGTEILYNWSVEVGDLHAYLPNFIHYDTTQRLACVNYNHNLQNGSGRTSMLCRGKPAGAYRSWLSQGAFAPKPTSRQPVIVQEKPYETENIGTLLLEVNDPFSLVRHVYFATAQGNNSLSAFVEDSSLPYSYDVTLADKQPSRIAYRIVGLLADGSEGILFENVVPFSAKQGVAATLTFAAAVPSTTNVRQDFVYGANTSFVDVWYHVQGTEPSLVSVEFSGTRLTNMPFRKGDGRGSAYFPVVSPGDWVLSTWIPYDSINGRGTPINRKAQSSAAPPAAPPAPTAITAVNAEQTSLEFTVTMPAVVTDIAYIRIYSTGGATLTTVARTAGSNANQTIILTGLAGGTLYSFYAKSVNATGTESTGSTSTLNMTTDVGTQLAPPESPSASLTGSVVTLSWAGGTGNPSGVTYQVWVASVEDWTTAAGFGDATHYDSTTSASMILDYVGSSSLSRMYMWILATKPGDPTWLDSVESAGVFVNKDNRIDPEG